MSFDKDFIWGAATAAYQIEGAASEDGKGLSVWDTCSRIQGFVKGGDTGDVACDHYHRFKEDVKLMKEIGLKAYRFSICWPRILPDGTGKINEKGLAFYEMLVDELLANGITPFVTLFHWDYPYELHKKGGWLNPESPYWFVDYTKIVVERLSDRVTSWMTQNEQQCYIGLGYLWGIHAPGLKMGFKDMLQAGHNSLLAHGKSVQAIRAYSKRPCEIGYATVGMLKAPRTESKEDIEAARTAMFSITDTNPFNNTWWQDPMHLGKYPEDGLKVYEQWLPEIGQDDMKTICQPLDFVGINNYQGDTYHSEGGKPVLSPRKPGFPINTLKWAITPEVLYWGPKFMYERYKLPILITENGLANVDWASVDEKVHDPQRIDYMHRYIRAFKKAAADGVPAKGYFCWSLMDNFEWAEGFNERFGLIYVDYETQKRTIKDSGYWFKSVIDSNGENLK